MHTPKITVRGAREHNLRDVNLNLPRNELICFTGVSGSGKSSLAFDTLYAEGQRRYVQSLSSYARQFLGQMPKPDVDLLSGLSPAISISQRGGGNSPRSTVGTITEIYDYLRVLYARVGTGHCPQCGRPITAQSRERIIERILDLPSGTKLMVLAPVVRGQKGRFRDLFVDLQKQGFVRARVDGRVVPLSDDPRLDQQMRHDIDVVIDRLTLNSKVRGRLAEAVELALRLAGGNVVVAVDGEQGEEREARDKERKTENMEAAKPRASKNSSPALSLKPLAPLAFSAHYACTHCNLSFVPPEPQLFSFNSPRGMCPECSGLGEIYSFDPDLLIPDPSRSFQQGCIELIGAWRGMGRWRRHIYRGVAKTLERKAGLPAGTILETAWEELDPKLQQAMLWGTGDEHITFTWRSGPSGYKWGGKYEGIVPKLLEKYRTTHSRPQRRQLEKYMRVIDCGHCNGARLNPQARAVTLTTRSDKFGDRPERSLPDVCALAVSDAREFFDHVELDAMGKKIAGEALKEIGGRLQFLENVGLEYLTLDRTAPTLSGGEMQRIRLAGQIGCGLVGVMYILDEPSIGLHQRDNDRLLRSLARLRDQGNTVVVVEHDEDTIRAADRVVDFGPGPGVRGGHVVVAGTVDEIAANAKSVTGQFISGRRRIEIPDRRRPVGEAKLVVREAVHNNLKGIDVEIPLGLFVCVTGVSGSGKSSLVGDILVESLRRDLNGGLGNPGRHRAIEGLENLDRMIAIDQSPIGRTPRSNPATYIKVFDEIRKLYAQLPDAKTRGYKSGRFSFNVRGGRCETCEGNGSTKLEMDFLADVWVTCPVCEGHRFNRETLQVRYKGKSIAQVLEMDVQEALRHFENVPAIAHKLQTLHDVGLDYMKLGQPSPTLSGGEAQRVKLARELVKKSTGRTLYLLDEPTTGLHFADIELLLKVLHGFVDAGNTVLVVEHNMDVIKTADWIIDLGPEGGAEGGYVVAAGTPEEVEEGGRKEKKGRKNGSSAHCFTSYTGEALKWVLGTSQRNKSCITVPAKPSSLSTLPSPHHIRIRGAAQHNLKNVDVDIPRDQLTVCCGPSGSGKTSLAIDTVYAEGQRRYVESLSAYARQFIGQMQKPKVDHVEGLSPAVAIEQKRAGHSPRSTVGTVTEIYDYLRILMSRLGRPYCPKCNVPIGSQSADEIIAKVMDRPKGMKLYLMAPLELRHGESYTTLWEETRASGYVRVRVDGQTYSVDSPPEIDRRGKHDVEVVVDRLAVRPQLRSRIAESVENALALGRGVIRVATADDGRPETDWAIETHSQHFVCDRCGRSFEPLSPHNFSFNSSLGWCTACEGLGTQVGTNPAALLRDSKMTLAQGAVALWPTGENQLFAAMLDAFSRETGVPLDVPFEQLGGQHRRLIFHGSGDRWFAVESRGEDGRRVKGGKRNSLPSLRFQFKGLYPALAEGSRRSPAMRAKLEHLVDEVECSVCCGSRLRDDAAAVRLRDRTIDEFCRMPLGQLFEELQAWNLDDTQRKIAGEVVREIVNRVQFLVDVGLEYLTLARPAPSLSGGEMQRIRLAAQLGSGLCGVLYVLDEPTIGLHPRDNDRLLSALRKLRDLGNTLLVVEHDRDVVAGADKLLDFGPAAGNRGGHIVAAGSPEQVARRRASVTGPYLSGKKAIPVPKNRRIERREERGAEEEGDGRRVKDGKRNSLSSSFSPLPSLTITGARHNNLKNIDVRIPLGVLTVVTGVSGSGKSSLVEDVLHASLARLLHRAKTFPGAHDAIFGIERINKVIRVDQQPIGQTPTSNPATFTGVFDLIRSLFAQLPEAKMRGYTARRFSFNVAGGRCERCEGNGQLCVEMHFLPDIWVECDTCQGKRYNPETLEVRFHGRSIADVLEMSCGEAVQLFGNIPKIRRPLQTLCDVGLDYLTLGQPAPTLSGGEAQRIKLAAELSRPDTGSTLYLLDEPTTGLHFDDIAKLLNVLNRLVDLGNTVVVIEHNLDVIKTADWIIDLGPEAGDAGGYVVAAGTPEDIVEGKKEKGKGLDVVAEGEEKPKSRRRTRSQKKSASKNLSPLPAPLPPESHTAAALAPVLQAGPHAERKPFDFAAEAARLASDRDISEIGREAKMPWQIDGRRWHTVDRVGRTGNPCRWDGRILAEVIDRIEEKGEKKEAKDRASKRAPGPVFSATDWNERTVVEIRAAKKSEGWFFHAITGEEWLLKMKFRVSRNTFRAEELIERLDLKPLNDMPDLPLYGTEPRVKCKNLRGPWQEVELRVHGHAEIDRPEFWEFVDRAVAGFGAYAEKAQAKPNILQPWKQLGRSWHLARRGFSLGKKVRWTPDVLEKLLDLLTEAAPSGAFRWDQKQTVPLYLPDSQKPWAAVRTKKLDAVYLLLNGPKGRFPLGRIGDLGHNPEVDGRDGEADVVRLKFRMLDDLARGDLRAFLAEHLAAVS